MAEISNKLGRKQEANETMQHVVDICRDAFVPEHPFTNRAKMHLKSILKGDLQGSLRFHQWFTDSAGEDMQPNIYGFLDLVRLV